MDTFLGKGIYSVSDAARIIRATQIASAQTLALRRWIGAHRNGHNGKTKYSEPMLLHGAQHVDGEYYLTFLQLIEARMIGAFRDLGVSMSTIRAAVHVLAEEYGVEHPFALKRLWTDGKRFYTDLLPKRLKDIHHMSDKQATHDILSGQYVFDIAHEYFLQNVDYASDIAGRLWPLGHERGIVMDPHRSFGRPIDSESGVSSYVLYAMRKGGTPEADVANWYGVKPTAVRASVEFELRMAA
jgi:uncharacterized protein (DUF433 family)